MTTRYFATCARGLEPILARELAALGADQRSVLLSFIAG